MERKLYRSNSNKKLFGLCGGLGEYFNVDATLVRLIFAIGTLCATVGFWVYILMSILTKPNPSIVAKVEDYVPSYKNLERKSSDKVFFGVCSGLADYFDLDTSGARIVMAVLALLGIGILGYVICALVMPSDKK